MSDLKSLRVQLDTIEIDTPQTMILANALLTLLGEVETLQRRMDDAWDAIERANPEAHLPEECQQHECSYYQHYLAYGPADLTHEGFHQAEKQCEIAQKKVSDWYDAHENDVRQPGQPWPRCPYEKQATYWEKAVRA